jgi:hypothetical protein
MVATRPDESWRMCRRSAEDGEALASPTPTPVLVLVWGYRRDMVAEPCSTALEERRPAIELQKAWRESFVVIFMLVPGLV